MITYFTVALVGFESPNYTVNESDGSVEVCIVVTNPPANEDLIFDIITHHVTRSGTAGNNIIINLNFKRISKVYIYE